MQRHFCKLLHTVGLPTVRVCSCVCIRACAFACMLCVCVYVVYVFMHVYIFIVNMRVFYHTVCHEMLSCAVGFFKYSESLSSVSVDSCLQCNATALYSDISQSVCEIFKVGFYKAVASPSITFIDTCIQHAPCEADKWAQRCVQLALPAIPGLSTHDSGTRRRGLCGARQVN